MRCKITTNNRSIQWGHILLKKEDRIYYGYNTDHYKNIHEVIDILNSIFISEYGIELDLELTNHITQAASDKSKKIPEGESLAEKHPEVLLDWDYDRNTGTSPYDVHAGSGLRVYLKGHKCGRLYDNYARRASTGCVSCKGTGRTATVGKDDLFTNQPKLMEE